MDQIEVIYYKEELIDFKNQKTAVNGIFEVECVEFNNDISNSVLCYYDFMLFTHL